LASYRSPSIAVLGGLGIGVVESMAAGYLSSGWKDFVVYGAMLAYLLVRGGVFLRGRASLAH
jgi:branched-chain amino acid transport system permease protein